MTFTSVSQEWTAPFFALGTNGKVDLFCSPRGTPNEELISFFVHNGYWEGKFDLHCHLDVAYTTCSCTLRWRLRDVSCNDSSGRWCGVRIFQCRGLTERQCARLENGGLPDEGSGGSSPSGATKFYEN